MTMSNMNYSSAGNIDNQNDEIATHEGESNNKKVQTQTTVKANSGRTRKSATAFRTISEVATELKVQQHVLRFWETKFTQVKPLKRGGGRRYYRPEDIAILKTIRHLLYTEGYTIKGVQKLLKGHGKNQIVNDGPAKPANEIVANIQNNAKGQEPCMSDKQKVILKSMLGELKDLRDMLRGDQGESQE